MSRESLLFLFIYFLQETIPDKVLKKRLNEAGLGERKVTFPKNADPKCLRDSLLKTFPKLEFAGGFDLMRSTSRVCLEVIHPPNCGYTTQFLSEESCIGQAIIYIRPLQKELDMTPRVTVSEVRKSLCIKGFVMGICFE